MSKKATSCCIFVAIASRARFVGPEFESESFGYKDSLRCPHNLILYKCTPTLDGA